MFPFEKFKKKISFQNYEFKNNKQYLNVDMRYPWWEQKMLFWHHFSIETFANQIFKN